MPFSLFFFTTLELIWPKSWPQSPTHLPFFAIFQLNMLEDSINFKNLCLQSSSSEKKMDKTSKNCYFLVPICTKKGSAWVTHNIKKILFGRNNKSRSSNFRNVLFYQIIICFGGVINLFLFCVMFFIKKGSFPVKTAVSNPMLPEIIKICNANA